MSPALLTALLAAACALARCTHMISLDKDFNRVLQDKELAAHVHAITNKLKTFRDPVHPRVRLFYRLLQKSISEFSQRHTDSFYTPYKYGKGGGAERMGGIQEARPKGVGRSNKDIQKNRMEGDVLLRSQSDIDTGVDKKEGKLDDRQGNEEGSDINDEINGNTGKSENIDYFYEIGVDKMNEKQNLKLNGSTQVNKTLDTPVDISENKDNSESYNTTTEVLLFDNNMQNKSEIENPKNKTDGNNRKILIESKFYESQGNFTTHNDVEKLKVLKNALKDWNLAEITDINNQTTTNETNKATDSVNSTSEFGRTNVQKNGKYENTNNNQTLELEKIKELIIFNDTTLHNQSETDFERNLTLNKDVIDETENIKDDEELSSFGTENFKKSSYGTEQGVLEESEGDELNYNLQDPNRRQSQPDIKNRGIDNGFNQTETGLLNIKLNKLSTNRRQNDDKKETKVTKAEYDYVQRNDKVSTDREHNIEEIKQAYAARENLRGAHL